ncbi:hypothetical protein A2645_01965 [Candidatus Nomurabacteria bacterium RIFCSPHIGHO2_01_FULL_39_9]|uniref:DUF4015 domain-containing protein n=1 Tax=Candidatus Nomurabacteria bacterium RIFCSPHIGHO2_01_FULL_39_9 TaxID=1801735 RepID=A0A1F6UX72_9BACT|nr:MAG: hypothetical protein A2645_01965 [Candidatus Nomurabacteria bacterium RIFCSPHIGHO2_01_FULL_39_9]
MKSNLKKTGVICGLFGLAVFGYFKMPDFFAVEFKQNPIIQTVAEEILPPEPPKIKVTHIETPTQVKGLYMTSYVAATPSIKAKVLGVVDRTEANALVVDIKDYRGRIVFKVNDPYLKEIGSEEDLIKNLEEFINELHAKNIYVIGRISVFQDAFLIHKWTDQAVKTKSGSVWKDRKGISWFDAGSKKVWDYIVAIAKESYSRGFDELQFDYIRFPSDGNMKDISYPFSEGKAKALVMKEFFAYLHENLKDTGAKTSADLFGMTTSNFDDLNIGQVLENAVPYFDYISPMVYPSHYPKTWNGFANPATKPYEVIKIAMTSAVGRLKVIGEDPKKLRPWLQDFNLGATYTADMVRKQIQATYDSGLDSWLIWDPANTYTEAALLKE